LGEPLLEEADHVEVSIQGGVVQLKTVERLREISGAAKKRRPFDKTRQRCIFQAAARSGSKIDSYFGLIKNNMQGLLTAGEHSCPPSTILDQFLLIFSFLNFISKQPTVMRSNVLYLPLQ